MANIENLKKYNHIHMRGIGGVSMSGIAEILHNWGFLVTGSDDQESENTIKLKSNGINVNIGYDINNLKNADCLVFTAAISKDDPEIVFAKENNIPIIERADFLGEITKCYENTIAISGTHGKTTTTSMVSLCFLEALMDPSIQVGAILKQIDGNYRTGNSSYFIIEACEYVESFLKFHPKAEIILNIDNDHLDYFKTFENVQGSFIKYVKILPEDGLLVLNGDDKACSKLKEYTKSTILTYSLDDKTCDYVAENVSFDSNGFASFDVLKNGTFYLKINLSVPGLHNVSNSLACIALCDYYKLPTSAIQNALKKFTGAHRRFEYVGSYNDASIYDDYGHHPTEIVATANALKAKKYNKSWVVFQPHTYSRTKNLLDDFAKALTNFDNIIITDIYAAREHNTYGISSENLVNKLKEMGFCAKYIPDFKDICTYLKENVSRNDIILTLGAGTVCQVGQMILGE